MKNKTKIRTIYLGSNLTILAVLLAFFFVQCSEQKKEEKTQPNILVVLCDDLGYNDVGFNGSTEITTPTLDKLANNGTIFSNAYVSHPFCGPSRASLMTGIYAHTIGAQFNLPSNDEIIGLGIDTTETYISKVLQDAGYYTGVIGKWHMGASAPYHPNKRGYDDFFGFLGGGHKYFPNDYLARYDQQKNNGVEHVWDYLTPIEHNGKEVRQTEYITDALSNHAVEFVNTAAKQKQPFFLYLSYNAPHVPLEAKEEDMAKFTHIKDKSRRTYAAMVYAVDRGVANVEKALKANGQFDNTLIVFFSDNGGKLTKGASNYPLREGKGSTCEGGYRVPMFFHWPNNVPAGQRWEHPITAIDFYPTFAGLAGAKIPEGKKLDGKDIWADFKAGNNFHKGDMIYCLRHREGYTDVGARMDDWKALRTEQNTWKLYNISNDISETNDLSAEHPKILEKLVNNAEAWSRTHKQPLWWHDELTGVEWKEKKMPHFEVTFALDD